MGWSYIHKPGEVSPEDYFREQYALEPDLKLKDIEAVNDVAYAAVEFKRPQSDKTEINAVVILLDRNGAGGHNFGWKEIPEQLGPVEDHCPARILNQLTDVEGKYANDWRRRCRAHLRQASQ